MFLHLIRTNEPKLVNFDYEGTIFKELKFEKPTDELVLSDAQ